MREAHLKKKEIINTLQLCMTPSPQFLILGQIFHVPT